jgi:CARDB/Beta-propeller repeat
MRKKPSTMKQTTRQYVSWCLLSFAIWLNGTAVVHGQNLDRAKQAQGDGQSGNGIAVDSAGNTYVTGTFQGTAIFGPGEVQQTVLTSAGENDIFVAKYGLDGALLWARRAGGAVADGGNAIAVDSAGNAYVTGGFGGTATFGPGEALETVLTATAENFSSIFVAKYNSVDGALLWAQSAVGTGGTATGVGIAVDTVGNAFVTGFFQLTATFAPGKAQQTQLIANPLGGTDIFVAAFAPDATLLWALRVFNNFGSESFGIGIALDSAGNVFITGRFGGGIIFSFNGEPGFLGSEGLNDILVAKFTHDGVPIWARQVFGDNDIDSGVGLAVDSAGNAYVTGFFKGTATFGRGEAHQTVLNALPFQDMFLAKYSGADGALLWARGVGGAIPVGDANPDAGRGVAVDSAGNAYVTGIFDGTATFGPGEAFETVLTAAGASDLFWAKYGPDGSLVWARRAGGAVSDEGHSIAVDSVGNSYVTGFFGGTATFGPGEPRQTLLTAAGGSDMFVAKFGQTLTAFAPAKLWFGAKDTNAVGIPLDVTVQVLLNKTVVGTSQITTISNGKTGFPGALLQTVPIDLRGQINVHSGDTLAFRVNLRLGCSRADIIADTVLLWFDGQPIDSGPQVDAGSRFGATIGGAASTFFLRAVPPFSLSRGAGQTRTAVSVTLVGGTPCPARPFVTIGTWSLVLPGPGLSGAWSQQPSERCTITGQATHCDIAAMLRVFNPGSVTADRSTTQVFLSSDAVLDAGDLLIEEEHSTGPLAPGESEDLPIQFRLNGQNAGGRFLIAVVDATNVVPEANESNNVIVSAPVP